jgi:hypothetical protein
LLDVEQNMEAKCLIASALRALFDFVYLRKKNYASINDLESDLRLDLEELCEIVQKYGAREIEDLGELYKKKTTKTLAEILIREYK